MLADLLRDNPETHAEILSSKTQWQKLKGRFDFPFLTFYFPSIHE